MRQFMNLYKFCMSLFAADSGISAPLFPQEQKDSASMPVINNI